VIDHPPILPFLSHGAFPFVGRLNELGRVSGFWDETHSADALRVLLILGEAGMGKSRLLDEVTLAIESRRGIVLRVRFLPEGANVPAAMIAQALATDEVLRPLLRDRAFSTPADVVAAMQRLSRLRATLLILEDIHALSSGSSAELGALLDSLAGESLSVVATARPAEGAHRGVIERHLVGQIELSGLDRDEIAQLWQRLLASEPEPPEIGALYEATAGNPLSLRSALRGALEAGTIAQRGLSYARVVSSDRFLNTLRHDLDRLGEGMAASLTEGERTAAELIAGLGEVFAREGAQSVLGAGADRMIEELTARGVIAPIRARVASLPGLDRDLPDHPVGAHPPYSFTHTLLHRHFLEHAIAHVAVIAGVIARGDPLFSLVPIRLVGQAHGQDLHLSADEGRRLVDRIRFTAIESLEFDPTQLRPLLEIARVIADRLGAAWTSDEKEEVEFGLAVTELSALSMEERHDDYERQAERLLEVTKNPRSERRASMRIGAIGKRNLYRLHDPANRRAIWTEMEELVDAFPGVVRSHNYAMLTTALSSVSGFQNDVEMGRSIEVRLVSIDADPSIGPAARYIRGWVAPNLLTLFASRSELDLRQRLLDQLESEPLDSGQRNILIENALQFLDSIGDYDRLLSTAERALPTLQGDTHLYKRVMARLARVKWLAAMGGDLDEQAESGEAIVLSMPEDARPVGRGYLYSALVQIALLRGEDAWARSTLALHDDGLDLLRPSTRLLIDLDDHPLVVREPLYVKDDPDITVLLHRLVEIASTGHGDLLEWTAAVDRLAERGPLSVSDVLLHRLIVELLERPGFEAGREHLSPVMERWTDSVALWMDERQLGNYLACLIDVARRYIPSSRIRELKKRIQMIRGQRSAQMVERRGDGRVEVRVIGEISVVDVDGEEKRPGGRMRRVLGAMAALELDEEEMDHRAFCSLVAGDDDPDRARNVVYVTLHRLREMLGADAIATQVDVAPRFDLGRVRVDVVEAHRAVTSGRRAFRRGNLLRAVPLVEKALSIIRGDVPFPGLYDDYFEEARDRLETSLRELMLRLGQRLVDEGDMERAEELYRRGIEAMPDDEEVAELLSELLLGLGRRREGERILRRSIEA